VAGLLNTIFTNGSAGGAYTNGRKGTADLLPLSLSTSTERSGYGSRNSANIGTQAAVVLANATGRTRLRARKKTGADPIYFRQRRGRRI